MSMTGANAVSYTHLDVYKRQQEEILRVEHLSRAGVLKDINFSLKAGEILGLAGLVGAGRTELARALFGVDFKDSGDIFIRGRPVNIKNPADAIKKGLCYLLSLIHISLLEMLWIG